MMQQRIWTVSLMVSTSLAAAAGAAEQPVPDVIDFSRDIRPILSDKCFHCHGPDAGHRKADLRLDRESGALGDRDGITAFKPGDLENSEAWYLINSDDPDERMPPVESNKTLNRHEIALLKRWIEQGAKWEGHWSFVAPRFNGLPKVKHADWPRNPIDHFVLAQLEDNGLSPSPAADRETLIRRVAYDLTGLPPTLSEIHAYLHDNRPDAYEKMVDRYLASEAFGERMALAWMDAARYGDTSVFHADGPRTMWPWRDWVINAYNRNMRFDQFTVQQLAGDLLPDATASQKIASGFLRNNGTTDEGGVIAEEYRVEYAVDRVKTTGNVWLGLSMECGQCHDHKYDPITQKDYYRFYAFFNISADKGMQTRKGNAPPLVNVPDERQEAEIRTLEARVAEIDRQLKHRVAAVEDSFQTWVTEEAAKRKAGDGAGVSADGLVAHFPLDASGGDTVANLADPKAAAKISGKARWNKGRHAGGLRVDNSTFIDAGGLGDFERSDAFSYGCWIKPDRNAGGGVIARMNNGNAYRGYDLYLSGGQVACHIIHKWPTDALKVTTNAKLKPGKWQHVFITYDGSSKAAGVRIYFNGKEQKWRIEQNGLKNTIRTKVPFYVGRRNGGPPVNTHVDDVRVYKRRLSAAEVGTLAGEDPIAPIFALAPDKRTPAQVDVLRSHYLDQHDAPSKKLKAEKAKISSRIAGIKKKKITSMVMGDMGKPRKTYVLMRGNYASPDKSQEVKPGVPEILSPMPEGAPANRLGLARWLTSDAHPLTARVAVNRYWSMFFGRGLVSTVMDFGSQGAWPTHPQLLDWLAVDFRDHGWNIKRTIKQMLMSATYRQRSHVTPQLRERDPENTLLARGPRFRLQGEFIRDTALAVSGLLSHKVGGPGVKPYQPPGLWNEVSLSGNVRFVQDKGPKLYRRSMYIYWKRSAPHPGMMIFDAPTRETCVVERPRTNTPLQALVTLNDVQFVEAARALAERMIKEGGTGPADRVNHGYRLTTAHLPSEKVRRALVGLYETSYDRYRGDAGAAKQLSGAGEAPRDASIDAAEHAAWTTVASVLLNMDRTLTRN